MSSFLMSNTINVSYYYKLPRSIPISSNEFCFAIRPNIPLLRLPDSISSTPVAGGLAARIVWLTVTVSSLMGGIP